MTNTDKTVSTEHEQALADRDWWRQAGDDLGLELRGWTFRNEASFVDRDTGRSVELPGSVAARIIETPRTQEPAGWLEKTLTDHAAKHGPLFIEDIEDIFSTLRAASITPPAPERSKEEVRDILQAVAHIGVDFGYGPYVLEEKFIKAAQELLDASPFPLPVTVTPDMDYATFAEWLRPWVKKRFGQWVTHNTAKGAYKALTAALSKPREQG